MPISFGVSTQNDQVLKLFSIDPKVSYSAKSFDPKISYGCPVCIDPFTKRHRPVHNGGFAKFEVLDCSQNPGGTSILGSRGGGLTSHQVWRQNLGQGPAKFTK